MARKQLVEEPDDGSHERPAERRDGEPAPPPGTVDSILWMQRAAGNAATRALLRDDTKPAPAKPKTDEEIWEEDWINPDFAAATKHFAGEDRPTGDPHFRYMHLAPLYKAVKGIDRPLKWVHENITWGTFYGHGTYLHKDLKAALATAETALKKDVPDAPFKKLWAFNPRTQTGGQWSNHADGKAIDFDEVTNPRLLDKGHRDVITALTGMDISAANPGAGQGLSSYDASREASQRFQARYTDEGMSERIDEISDDEGELKQEGDALSDAIAAIPTGKKKGDPKPTAEQKEDLKRLKKELAPSRPSWPPRRRRARRSRRSWRATRRSRRRSTTRSRRPPPSAPPSTCSRPSCPRSRPANRPRRARRRSPARP